MPKFTYPIPLRWADADSYGHVNNSRYLTFLEEARTRMVQELLPTDETERRRHAFVVQQSVIEYKTPLDYRDQPVHVDVWVVTCRGARLELGYTIRDGEHTYAEATTKMAAYNLETGAPRRISAAETDFFGRYTAE
ncbi:thioesterase family protein [Streptomyces sp. NPDC004732]|uniref:acyl-CoA thioesterase n=1 Tax=Streptomyces sp. NPDC004732 TaxID=3154290 RepID=UPI0033AF36ED